jgi:hypothetical protein
MNLVIIESPFAGEVEANIEYAKACVRDALMRGEDPLASHLLYTQEGILDDTIPAERARGISAGLHWYKVADKCAVYCDRGVSSGMIEGIITARNHNKPIIFRYLYEHPDRL